MVVLMKAQARAAVLTLLIGITVLPVSADFRKAVDDFAQKRYSEAYTEFDRLAKLGDGPSQRNLAAMYFNGYHVERDLISAYVWASLAADQLPDTIAMRDRIYSKLSDEQKALATTRYTEMNAQYGSKVLAENLFPVFSEQEAECTVDVESPAKPIKLEWPSVPNDARYKNNTAEICVEMLLDKSGKPKQVFGVSKSATHKKAEQSDDELASAYEKSVIVSLKKSRFEVALEDELRSVPQMYCVSFVTRMSSNGENPVKEQEKKRKLMMDRLKQDEGDTEALNYLASAYEFDATLLYEQKRRERANEYMQLSQRLSLKSAIYGDASSQLNVASDLLTGNRCVKDTKKGLFWLTLASQQGNTNAQFLLGATLLSGKEVERQPEKAAVWLKSAADGGHRVAKLAYAKLLLKTNAQALSVITPYLPDTLNENNFAHLEIKALVAAHQGDFSQAAQLQEKVLEQAKLLELDLGERESRLHKFKDGILPIDM